MANGNSANGRLNHSKVPHPHPHHPPMEGVEEQRGAIRSVQAERGFGFLVGEDGIDRFFHCTQLTGIRLDHLTPGQPVYFVPEEDRGRGPRACSVRLAPSSLD